MCQYCNTKVPVWWTIWLGYISKCMEDVTVIKNITRRANDKPWFIKAVCELLRARNAAFKSGDKDALRTATANLNWGRENSQACLWTENSSLCGGPYSRWTPEKLQVLTTYWDVCSETADQLTDVLTDIYNTSLSQAIIPACFKATTIIPLPKKSPASTQNDYRPIALTPIMMKRFERLVKAHITSSLPSTLDPFQFAYRPKRSTDDAIATALHLSLAHLENNNSYVRMLFIDFSSSFNRVIPQHLVNKLSEIGISTPLCNWLLDFLTNRPQTVRVGSNSSWRPPS